MFFISEQHSFYIAKLIFLSYRVLLLFTFKLFFIIVQIQLSPSTALPHPTHPHLPPSILPTFGFVHGSFIHVPWQPFTFFSLLSSSHLPSGYCQFGLYFNVSGSILLACFFLLIRFHLQVGSYGVCLTACLISLSIMLSSSIHAVAKGI